MDIQALHSALQQSFSADSSMRLPAEHVIKNLKHVPGATIMLLQIAAERHVQYEVRQAAAIHLKNIIRECWTASSSFSSANLQNSRNPQESSLTPSSSSCILADNDKNIIRVVLTEALVSEPEKSIRDLLAETLHTIAIHDYPNLWPDLLPSLLRTIATFSPFDINNDTISLTGTDGKSQNSTLRVHNSLLALHRVCKRYEYKPKEQRGPLLQIVHEAFPLLLKLAQSLLQPAPSQNSQRLNEYSNEVALILKQILKIYWSCTQFYLPGTEFSSSTDETGESNHSDQHGVRSSAVTTAERSLGSLANPTNMEPWFNVLLIALSKPLPEELQPTQSIEERNAWPWWKVKKRTCQIIARLFSRYGIPKYAEDDVKEFSTYFSQRVAPQLLGPICELLSLRSRGMFCSDRVIHFSLSFIDMAVELAPTYKLLKPHLDFLLFHVCFPTICLTSEDIDMFFNDPHEFIRRQSSPLADFYDPRISALGVINNLVKHRGKDVSGRLLGFLTGVLQGYDSVRRNEIAAAGLSGLASIPTSLQDKDHIQKDGALLAIGSLSQSLLSKKKYASEVEIMMITSIFPEFTSPIGFLRCRACWMVERFHNITWTDDGTRLRTLITLVLQRLSDPELPVQIEASKALRYLIESDGAEKTLLPVLPQILNEYFRIMNEIGNDEVVSALQAVIDRFGDHIEPHAIVLVSQLASAFSTYCDCGEDDDEAAMAAAQCLECISTVLNGSSGRPDIYNTLEPTLVPLLMKILGNDGEFIEYLEHALDILTYLTFFNSQISPELWEVFPQVYLAFDQYAFDYLNVMIAPLENYIGKAPQHFIGGSTTLPNGENVTFIDLIFKMVDVTVSEERSTESDIRIVLTLFMSILHNCNGMVDRYISPINDIILAKLGQQAAAVIPLTRISIFQVIGSALYYNPQLELMELEKRGVTHQVFMQWMKDTEHMEKWIPRKLTVLGLTSILQLPTSSFPPTIALGLSQLVTAVIHMAHKMNEELEQEPENDSIEEEVEEGADDEDFDGYGEDEDVSNVDDEVYMDAISKLKSGADGDMSRFLVGDDWGDDEEEENFSSPIDDVNEFLYFSDIIRAAFQREPEVYQQLQVSLAAESVAKCQKLFIYADSNRSKIQEGKS